MDRAALGYILIVEAVGVGAVGVVLGTATAPRSAAWLQCAVLLAMSIGYAEASDRVERFRRFLCVDKSMPNYNSVLCFAGVLVLPTSLALLLVVGIYAHSYLRGRRHQTITSYRFLFTAAVILIMTTVCSFSFLAMGGGLAKVGPVDAVIVLAVLALHEALNLVLLTPAVYLAARPPSLHAVLPERRDVAYELATLLLSVLTAVVTVHAIWFAPISLVVLAVWHRASLVTQLQRVARIDSKTGLLNSGAWRELAERQLAQAGTGVVSLLLIDLDHFKKINDAYGHLAGDRALRAVADAMIAELRGYDAVGRYGGEEFIALLPRTSRPDAVAIAQRLRTVIAEVSVLEQRRVTASIGVSSTNGRKLVLNDLIEAADRAMYSAKADGRDKVAVG
ncbi:MAG TPA: GGDEF domain-containing protein [Jatrophihabitans sp.]